MHTSPIKSRTGQKSIRAELEAVACAIVALDMPLRVRMEPEWVETGVKDILDAAMKGRAPTKREHEKSGY